MIFTISKSEHFVAKLHVNQGLL